MKRIGQRIIARYFRSRVLPITTIFLLLALWLVVVATILWQVKVKEEFPVSGHLYEGDEGDAAGLAIKGEKVIHFVGISEGEKFFLEAGEDVKLYRNVTQRNDSGYVLDAKLLWVETRSPNISFRLGVRNWEPAKRRYWFDEDGNSSGQFMLVVRRKRLLLIVWERTDVIGKYKEHE